MEDFEIMAEPEALDDIGTQVNNCCADCASLDRRVSVAERDIEYLQTSKASTSVVDPLVRDVEWMNANKADKTTTNALLTEMESLKLNKASKTELAAKADVAYVDSGLATKADRDSVELALAEKADKTSVQQQFDALVPAKNGGVRKMLS